MLLIAAVTDTSNDHAAFFGYMGIAAALIFCSRLEINKILEVLTELPKQDWVFAPFLYLDLISSSNQSSLSFWLVSWVSTV